MNNIQQHFEVLAKIVNAAVKKGLFDDTTNVVVAHSALINVQKFIAKNDNSIIEEEQINKNSDQ